MLRQSLKEYHLKNPVSTKREITSIRKDIRIKIRSVEASIGRTGHLVGTRIKMLDGAVWRKSGHSCSLDPKKNQIDDAKSSRSTTGQTQSPSPVSG
jgi:hypothetical protein